MSFAQADLSEELLALEAQLPNGDHWAGVELTAEDWSRLVRLARGEVLPARRPYSLAVLGCSATKAAAECDARDLYTGTLFKSARQLAEMVADTYVILSARHGVVEPLERLEPYDLKLDDLPAPARATWGDGVAKQLKSLIAETRPAPVLWLAGESYWQPSAKGLRDARQSYVRPLVGRGIGEQVAKLKELIGEAEARGFGAAYAAAERREVGL